MRPGSTAREEILDAAAELFTNQGFANTSTRAIADAVGIRQSSLYHHFATKEDILGELLDGTVAPSLAFARTVHRIDRPGKPVEAAARLHAVALFDGSQLCQARWNLGVLYHLPEARTDRFQRFANDRLELRNLYRALGKDVEDLLAPGPKGRAPLGDLMFRLVESLISLRADGLSDTGSASQTADAGIELAGLASELEAVRARSEALVSSRTDLA